jgi:formyl-CoA transferase
MVALREAGKKGGRGQVIDLPLLDPLFAIVGPQAAELPPHRRSEAAHRQPLDHTAPRNVYRCKDGKYVGLSASTQKWPKGRSAP